MRNIHTLLGIWYTRKRSLCAQGKGALCELQISCGYRVWKMGNIRTKTKLYITYFAKKEISFGQGLYCRSLDLYLEVCSAAQTIEITKFLTLSKYLIKPVTKELES